MGFWYMVGFLTAFTKNQCYSQCSLSGCPQNFFCKAWVGPDISMKNLGKQVSVTFYKMFIHSLSKLDGSGESWMEVVELK